MSKSLSAAVALLLLAGCASTQVSSPLDSEVQIAFLADVHFHDVYGRLSEFPERGLDTETVDRGKQKALIRSMKAQLHSTRLFNENYFVFLAALEDLARRGIKLVALPGDFSDDGQPLHIRGLSRLLQQYERQHGMRFFAIPGNHDPVRPFTHASGKADFLAADGRELAIYSRAHSRCMEGAGDSYLVCSDDLQKWGYKEIMHALADYGFAPKDEYLLYETPFGTDEISGRYLNWCLNPDQPQDCIKMPDASYLVEPVPGLWLLAIDANVYIPRDRADPRADTDPFQGSSNAGYNAMLKYKPEIIDWVKDVVKRANAQNKQLIAFSHFPMADFYDGAARELEAIFGAGRQQLKRMPVEHTAKALANTGLRVHVGGHMHINDTGTVKADNGDVLFNIQAPTLAAYRPAYKLFTLKSRNEIEVETVLLDEVPRFDELFKHYRREHTYLRSYEPEKAWREDILKSNSYGEFTDVHLQELIRLRYLPREWPADLVKTLTGATAASLLEKNTASQCASVQHMTALVEQTGLTWEQLAQLPGSEIINDFYRLRNADSIALVSDTRKVIYNVLSQAFAPCDGHLTSLFGAMHKFISAQPSNHLLLDLQQNTLTPLVDVTAN